MKSKTFIAFPFLAVAMVLSGCASSPVAPMAQYSGGNAVSDIAVLGVAGAGGAVAGHAINAKYGAPVGAVVGLGAGAVTNSIMDSKKTQALSEAYEQGARDARILVMNQYWMEKSQIPPQANGAPAQAMAARQVAYEAGTYDGVMMLPRVESTPVALDGEPTR